MNKQSISIAEPNTTEHFCIKTCGMYSKRNRKFCLYFVLLTALQPTTRCSMWRCYAMYNFQIDWIKCVMIMMPLSNVWTPENMIKTKLEIAECLRENRHISTEIENRITIQWQVQEWFNIFKPMGTGEFRLSNAYQSFTCCW